MAVSLVCSGYLRRLSGPYLSTNPAPTHPTYYYELHGPELFYWKSKPTADASTNGVVPPRGMLLLSGMTILEDAGCKNCWSVSSADRAYAFLASSERDTLEWVDAFKAAVQQPPPVTTAFPHLELGRGNIVSDEEAQPAHLMDPANSENQQLLHGNDQAPPSSRISLQDFEVLATIGRGSFGRVYLVQLKYTGEFFAMKSMNKTDADQQQLLEQIYSEKSILQTISHPFIVGLRYAFQTKERVFLVLDLLAGGELFHHLVNGNFDEYRAKFYTMLFGLPPFYNENQNEMYEKILSAPLVFPDEVPLSEEGKDLLTKLLDRDPDTRLQDVEAFKAHPFFHDINFDDLYQRKLPPPFKPNPDTLQNFDTELTSQPPVVGDDMTDVMGECYSGSMVLLLLWIASSVCMEEERGAYSGAHCRDWMKGVNSTATNESEREKFYDSSLLLLLLLLHVLTIGFAFFGSRRFRMANSRAAEMKEANHRKVGSSHQEKVGWSCEEIEIDLLTPSSTRLPRNPNTREVLHFVVDLSDKAPRVTALPFIVSTATIMKRFQQRNDHPRERERETGKKREEMRSGTKFPFLFSSCFLVFLSTFLFPSPLLPNRQKKQQQQQQQQTTNNYKFYPVTFLYHTATPFPSTHIHVPFKEELSHDCFSGSEWRIPMRHGDLLRPMLMLMPRTTVVFLFLFCCFAADKTRHGKKQTNKKDGVTRTRRSTRANTRNANNEEPTQDVYPRERESRCYAPIQLNRELNPPSPLRKIKIKINNDLHNVQERKDLLSIWEEIRCVAHHRPSFIAAWLLILILYFFPRFFFFLYDRFLQSCNDTLHYCYFYYQLYPEMPTTSFQRGFNPFAALLLVAVMAQLMCTQTTTSALLSAAAESEAADRVSVEAAPAAGKHRSSLTFPTVAGWVRFEDEATGEVVLPFQQVNTILRIKQSEKEKEHQHLIGLRQLGAAGVFHYLLPASATTASMITLEAAPHHASADGGEDRAKGTYREWAMGAADKSKLHVPAGEAVSVALRHPAAPKAAGQGRRMVSPFTTSATKPLDERDDGRKSGTERFLRGLGGLVALGLLYVRRLWLLKVVEFEVMTPERMAAKKRKKWRRLTGREEGERPWRREQAVLSGLLASYLSSHDLNKKQQQHTQTKNKVSVRESIEYKLYISLLSPPHALNSVQFHSLAGLQTLSHYLLYTGAGGTGECCGCLRSELKIMSSAATVTTTSPFSSPLVTNAVVSSVVYGAVLVCGFFLNLTTFSRESSEAAAEEQLLAWLQRTTAAAGQPPAGGAPPSVSRVSPGGRGEEMAQLSPYHSGEGIPRGISGEGRAGSTRLGPPSSSSWGSPPGTGGRVGALPAGPAAAPIATALERQEALEVRFWDLFFTFLFAFAPTLCAVGIAGPWICYGLSAPATRSTTFTTPTPAPGPGEVVVPPTTSQTYETFSLVLSILPGCVIGFALFGWWVYQSARREQQNAISYMYTDAYYKYGRRYKVQQQAARLREMQAAAGRRYHAPTQPGDEELGGTVGSHRRRRTGRRPLVGFTDDDDVPAGGGSWRAEEDDVPLYLEEHEPQTFENSNDAPGFSGVRHRRHRHRPRRHHPRHSIRSRSWSDSSADAAAEDSSARGGPPRSMQSSNGTAWSAGGIIPGLPTPPRRLLHPPYPAVAEIDELHESVEGLMERRRRREGRRRFREEMEQRYDDDDDAGLEDAQPYETYRHPPASRESGARMGEETEATGAGEQDYQVANAAPPTTGGRTVTSASYPYVSVLLPGVGPAPPHQEWDRPPCPQIVVWKTTTTMPSFFLLPFNISHLPSPPETRSSYNPKKATTTHRNLGSFFLLLRRQCIPSLSYQHYPPPHPVTTARRGLTNHTMPSKKGSQNKNKPNGVCPAVPATIPGGDTEGRFYANTETMWEAELQGDLYNTETGWYGKAIKYWENAPADMNGVLGGLEELHLVDIPETRAFLQRHMGDEHEHTRALDCAAGIGRVSKYLLTEMYETVDLLEPLPHMLEQAKKELEGKNIGEFILGSMETVDLPENKYDLIMIQWAVIYLTDEDFVRFFSKCKKALRPHGRVVLKENCSAQPTFLVDRADSSLTRCDAHYRSLFEAAGLTVTVAEKQRNWPKDCIPVMMYALA
eukprot:gene5834-4160_t